MIAFNQPDGRGVGGMGCGIALGLAFCVASSSVFRHGFLVNGGIVLLFAVLGYSLGERFLAWFLEKIAPWV